MWKSVILTILTTRRECCKAYDSFSHSFHMVQVYLDNVWKYVLLWLSALHINTEYIYITHTAGTDIVILVGLCLDSCKAGGGQISRITILCTPVTPTEICYFSNSALDWILLLKSPAVENVLWHSGPIKIPPKEQNLCNPLINQEQKQGKFNKNYI